MIVLRNHLGRPYLGIAWVEGTWVTMHSTRTWIRVGFLVSTVSSPTIVTGPVHFDNREITIMIIAIRCYC